MSSLNSPGRKRQDCALPQVFDSGWEHDEDGRTTPPDGLGLVAQLGLGDDHSCALTVSGQVRCWGGPPLSVTAGSLQAAVRGLIGARSGHCSVTESCITGSK